MIIGGKREIEGTNIQVLTAENGRYKENDYAIETIKEMANKCGQVAVKIKGNELAIVGTRCGAKNRESKIPEV